MNSTNTPPCLYWHTGSLECRTLTDLVCVICISFPWLVQRPGLPPFFITFRAQISQVLLDVGCRPLLNFSLPHTTSILLTRTKVYGYKVLKMGWGMDGGKCAWNSVQLLSPLFTFPPRNKQRNCHQVLICSGQQSSVTWRKTWIWSPVANHSQMNYQKFTGMTLWHVCTVQHFPQYFVLHTVSLHLWVCNLSKYPWQKVGRVA